MKWLRAFGQSHIQRDETKSVIYSELYHVQNINTLKKLDYKQCILLLCKEMYISVWTVYVHTLKINVVKTVSSIYRFFWRHNHCLVFLDSFEVSVQLLCLLVPQCSVPHPHLFLWLPFLVASVHLPIVTLLALVHLSPSVSLTVCWSLKELIQLLDLTQSLWNSNRKLFKCKKYAIKHKHIANV